MILPQTTLKSDATRITLWALFLPALVAWPFTSAFPAFGILAGGGTAFTVSVQVLLLLTGFWGFAAVAAGVWVMLDNQARDSRLPARETLALMLGAYATVWTALYLIFSFASR